MTEQTYLVLIRDGKLALAMAAALQQRLAEDGAGGMALVPSTRCADFASIGPASREYLRQAVWCGGTQAQVVTLYEDGLVSVLESLGLCAYIGVPEDHDWRVLHFDGAGGAMLLPVATARDLVDAVAEYTPWHEYAAAAVVPTSRRAVRRSRLVPAGPLSRRLAIVGVAAPLLTVGLPVAVAAAQTAAPQAPAAPQQHSSPAVSSAGPTVTAPLTLPPAGTSASDVKSWWQQQTQQVPADQLQQFVNANAAQIGNMNGIPSAIRDYANRQVLNNLLDPSQSGSVQSQITNVQTQISSLQNQMTSLGTVSVPREDVLAQMADQVSQYQAQLSNLQQQLSGLQAIQQQVGANSGAFPASTDPAVSQTPATSATSATPGWLLSLNINSNPGTGSVNLGTYSVAFGPNPDGATHTAVWLPGLYSNLVNTSDNAQVSWYLSAAQTMAATANANPAGSGQTTSVVFIQYPAPVTGPTALSPDMAKQAAPGILQTLQGMNALNPSTDLSVTGYSYGSQTLYWTLDQASSSGLAGLMNRVAFVAPPGFPGNPSQFGVPWTWTANENDIVPAGVSKIPWSNLGSNPFSVASAAGVTPFDSGTGSQGSFLNLSWNNISVFGYNRAAHSDYFPTDFDPTQFWPTAMTSQPALWNLVNFFNGNLSLMTPQGTSAISGIQQMLNPANWNGVPISWATGDAPPTPNPITGGLDPSNTHLFGDPQVGLPSMVSEFINGPSGPPLNVSPQGPPGWAPLPLAPWPGASTAPQNQNLNSAPTAPQDPPAQPVAPASGGGGAGGGAAGGVQGLPGTQSGPAVTPAADPQPVAPDPGGGGAGGGAAGGVQGLPGTQSGPAVTPAADPQPVAPDPGGGGAGGGAAGGVQGLPGTPSRPAVTPAAPATDPADQQAAAQAAQQAAAQQAAAQQAADQQAAAQQAAAQQAAAQQAAAQQAADQLAAQAAQQAAAQQAAEEAEQQASAQLAAEEAQEQAQEQAQLQASEDDTGSFGDTGSTTGLDSPAPVDDIGGFGDGGGS